MSPAAITAHVKALEARLGVTLFAREAQRVRLTEAGRRVLPALTAAFDAMAEASAALRQEAVPLALSIATLPSIAQLWLRPRLAALEAAMPGLAVSITAMEAPPTTRRDATDIALFMGPGGRDVLVPVAAPGCGTAPRLGDATWTRDWTLWQAGAPETWPPGKGTGPVHSLYALAVEDALRGRGVLMARLSLLGPLLDEGRLVELGPRVRLAEGLEVTARSARPAVARAARWLAAQMDAGHGGG